MLDLHYDMSVVTYECHCMIVTMLVVGLVASGGQSDIDMRLRGTFILPVVIVLNGCVCSVLWKHLSVLKHQFSALLFDMYIVQIEFDIIVCNVLLSFHHTSGDNLVVKRTCVRMHRDRCVGRLIPSVLIPRCFFRYRYTAHP